jgi:hypothetical protein
VSKSFSRFGFEGFAGDKGSLSFSALQRGSLQRPGFCLTRFPSFAAVARDLGFVGATYSAVHFGGVMGWVGIERRAEQKGGHGGSKVGEGVTRAYVQTSTPSATEIQNL